MQNTRFVSVNVSVLFKAYVIEMIALALPRNRIFMKSTHIEHNRSQQKNRWIMVAFNKCDPIFTREIHIDFVTSHAYMRAHTRLDVYYYNQSGLFTQFAESMLRFSMHGKQ